MDLFIPETEQPEPSAPAAPKKVIRDGKVAVLFSPGFGAGWSSWNFHPDCLFSPEIVALVEGAASHTIIEAKARELFGDRFCVLGAEDLKVMWLPEGILFRIDEYDGSESVVLCESEEWIGA